MMEFDLEKLKTIRTGMRVAAEHYDRRAKYAKSRVDRGRAALSVSAASFELQRDKANSIADAIEAVIG